MQNALNTHFVYWSLKASDDENFNVACGILSYTVSLHL